MLNKHVTFTVGLTTSDGAKLGSNYVVQGVSEILAAEGVYGFTVTKHLGYWKGEPEKSLSFTVIYDSNALPGFSPHAVAGVMAKQFYQEAVLYVIHGVFADLVYAEEN